MAYGKIKADAIVYDNSGSDVEVSTADITSKAGTASPTFTGTPTAPTAAAGTDTTQIATTEFVNDHVTANALALAGGTLTGDLVLSGDPDANLKAATKQYVDTQVGSAAQTTGGTFTGDVTFNEAISIERVKEKATLTNVNTNGTINFDVKTQAILYHTGSTNGTFTLNMRGDSSTSLDSIMSVNDVLTVVFIAPQNSSSYYCTAITVDANTPSTIKWVGGAPTSGNSANVISSYSVSIVKTAAATFTVLANLTDYE